jgi:hypothetical protein
MHHLTVDIWIGYIRSERMMAAEFEATGRMNSIISRKGDAQIQAQTSLFHTPTCPLFTASTVAIIVIQSRALATSARSH